MKFFEKINCDFWKPLILQAFLAFCCALSVCNSLKNQQKINRAYIVSSFSSLLSLSSVLSLHEGIVFFVFASFRLAVCPVDFFPMGERRKRQKIWIENPFTFSGYSSYSPGLKVRRHIPLRVLCLLVLLCAVQNREKSTENQHPYSEQYKMTY